MAEKKLYEISTHHTVEHPTLEGEVVIICDGGLTFAKMRQVDALEVVHGRWVPVGTYEVCSHCGFEINRGERIREFFLVDNQHCRWCGAKMDGDGNG